MDYWVTVFVSLLAFIVVLVHLLTERRDIKKGDSFGIALFIAWLFFIASSFWWLAWQGLKVLVQLNVALQLLLVNL